MDNITEFKKALAAADSVLIGAGAGMSASAGFVYTGEVFKRDYADFIAKYGFSDLYSASFYPFAEEEEYWAFWSRVALHERYEPIPKPWVFSDLLSLVKGKDYFVITTNVDHTFQRSGFDKRRLFYTQGDYGLWQCKTPCCQKTVDNEETVKRLINAQSGTRIPTDMIPRCPFCGGRLTQNLRCDDKFVQDAGWYAAAHRYEEWISAHRDGNILLLDLGTGMGTPEIFKYPFMRMTYANPKAVYAVINLGEAFTVREIAERSICIDSDIGEALRALAEDEHGPR